MTVAHENEGSAGTGGTPVPAAVVAVLAWALAVVSVVVFAAARPTLDADQLFFLVDVVGAAVYGTVTGVVLARRVHPVPIITAVAAIGPGIAALSYAWSRLALVRPELPFVGALAPLQNSAWIPGTLALFLVVPWLVRDGTLGQLEQIGVAAGTVATVWFWWARTYTDTADLWLVLPVVVVGFLAAAHVLWRRRTAPAAESAGLGWLALGAALMTASYIPLAVPGLPWMLTPLIHLATQAFYPVAILVVVLRQRLWGLDFAVSRAALAGSLVAVLAAGYLVVAVTASLMLPTDGSVAAQAIAATAVALAVQPVRSSLTRRVHRLVYGDGIDSVRAVQNLGRHFAGAGTPRRLLGDLTAGIGTALRLESVTVSRDGEILARWGEPTGRAEEMILDSGTLTVTAPPGEALGPRSLRALGELATVVEAGLVVLRSAEELDAARHQLREARLEERRTIRRELHDGLGPSLAGIRLGLQGARNLAGTDPKGALELIDALLRELDHQVEGVRELSRGLLPPVLDELGLVAAVDELAGIHSNSGFTIDVDADAPAGLSRAVAAAAYGITVEAVTNARRHSGARGCTVRIHTTGDLLTVEVSDDGRGRGPDARAGVGTHSMRERARDVGGVVDITEAHPHGTVVRARLPWTATSPAVPAGES
ncbi:sensor histidine kinase [Rhodococcus sp. HM1]|uniref:sensor histidine kinase n=1 Tax=Rhodococcus sp. HM1 TaxID=2937759 RepID=UPI00200B5A4E|nr:sensor histidine kinase [Rhodococcus sp. HM1]MCK8671772.1 sensor histidine kinase [Rhodococcus sp. HM1]